MSNSNISETISAVPVVGVSTLTLLNIPVAHWVLILNLIYIVGLITFKVYNFFYNRRKDKQIVESQLGYTGETACSPSTKPAGHSPAKGRRR